MRPEADFRDVVMHSEISDLYFLKKRMRMVTEEEE